MRASIRFGCELVGLQEDQILASREGNGGSDKVTAALTFAEQVLESKGRASETDIEAVRAANFSDGEITEIIVQVALNVVANYFNEATAVDIDFPKVSRSELK